MKKFLSIVMSVLMLTGMLAMFVVPAMADGTDDGTTTEQQALVMYVSVLFIAFFA